MPFCAMVDRKQKPRRSGASSKGKWSKDQGRQSHPLTGKIEATAGPKENPGRGHGRGRCGSADRGAHDPIRLELRGTR